MSSLSRRSLLGCTALALGAAILPTGAHAAVPFAKAQGPGVYRMQLGNYQITALYDGLWPVPIDEHFIRNASAADVDAALAAGFLPPRILPISFTALAVNTGRQLILIDTGTAGQITDTAGVLPQNLKTAGIAPSDVDLILISHFHPDHINGLRGKDGERLFPRAEVAVPEPEWAFWMDDAVLSRGDKPVHHYALNARRIFRDIASDVRRFTPGEEVAPGIVSVPAFGHTPGHTAFAVHSGRESLLVMSDTARIPYLFVRHPEWQPAFDMDGPTAAAARMSMLDRAAADRMLVHAYHFPFPAVGHIARSGRAYDFQPALWQPL